MLDIPGLIQSYGYFALAIGAFLEGETILIAAGLAAHNGYLNPFAVVSVAAVCGFAGDQFFFWLGRRHGAAILRRWPSINRQADRVHRLVERYDAPVIIGVRFAYGLRIAGPILIGMLKISRTRFALYNAVGAVLWAVLIAGIGWVFGRAATHVLGNVQHLEAWLLLALVSIVAISWWRRKVRVRKARARVK